MPNKNDIITITTIVVVLAVAVEVAEVVTVVRKKKEKKIAINKQGNTRLVFTNKRHTAR